MNCQRDDQRCGDLAEMARGVFIEMTGCARGANVMNILADTDKQSVARRCRRRHCPPTTVIQAFGYNGKEGYAKERSRRETDQCTKRLVRQSQQGAARAADKSEPVSRYHLPKDDFAVHVVALAEKSCGNRKRARARSQHCRALAKRSLKRLARIRDVHGTPASRSSHAPTLRARAIIRDTHRKFSARAQRSRRWQRLSPCPPAKHGGRSR